MLSLVQYRLLTAASILLYIGSARPSTMTAETSMKTSPLLPESSFGAALEVAADRPNGSGKSESLGLLDDNGEDGEDNGEGGPLMRMSEMDKETVAAVEQSLLSSFGLDSRPQGVKVVGSNGKKNSKVAADLVPDALWDMYYEKVGKSHASQSRGVSSKRTSSSVAGSSRSDYRLATANTIRSLPHIESTVDDQGSAVTLHFHFGDRSSTPSTEQLLGGQLRLYRPSLSLTSDPSVTLSAQDNSSNQTIRPIVLHISIYQVLHQTRRPFNQRKSSAPLSSDPPAMNGEKKSKGSVSITRLLDTRIITVRRDDPELWERFDVTPAVEGAWSSNVEEEVKFGVKVEVRRVGSSQKHGQYSSLLPPATSHLRLSPPLPLNSEPVHETESLIDTEREWRKVRPVLLLYSHDTKYPRGSSHRPTYEGESPHNEFPGEENERSGRDKRRASGGGKRKRERGAKRVRTTCMRHGLYVDFTEVGWQDWIVAPPGYQAQYCMGECPFLMGAHLNTTNHAIIQSLVHDVDPSAVPKPCCVPTELGPMAMLYFDKQSQVILKQYQDMIVDACGCR